MILAEIVQLAPVIFLSGITANLPDLLAEVNLESGIVRAICGEDNIAEISPETDGIGACQVCPSFTSDGESGYNSEGANAILTAISNGSFTDSDRVEAVVDLSGCDPHVGNFGGSVLLRQSGSRWRVVNYENGYRSQDCLTVETASDRDLLVCRASYTGMGYINEWLDVRQHSNTDIESTQLLGVESNIHACRSPFFDVRIVDFELQDENEDGWKDVVATVSSAVETNPTPGAETNCDLEPNLSEPTLDRLTFLFDGRSFQPTPETAQRIEELEAIANP